MITHYYRTLKDIKLKVCERPRAGIWTHVVSPTEEELVLLVADYALDEAIVADINDFFEMPRFERSGNVAYFFTRYPFDEKTEDTDTAPILIIIGESFVVTISKREAPFLTPFIDGDVDIHTTQKTKTFLDFMSALTFVYEKKISLMRKAVYRDRTRIDDIKAQDIQRFVSYEHELNDTIAAMVPTNVWLKQLSTGNYIHMYNEDVELMEDLMIANNQLVDSAKAVLKTIQNIRKATESILTQKLNSTIKLLTALTVILTIPTLFSSVYGMNIALPLSERPDAFWLLIGLIITIMSVTTYLFINKRWF